MDEERLIGVLRLHAAVLRKAGCRGPLSYGGSSYIVDGVRVFSPEAPLFHLAEADRLEKVARDLARAPD